MAKKILIVDDEPDLLKVVVFRVRNSGYEVLTACDGKEALAMIEKEAPDLIFLDLRLPVIDGIEVCKKIKGSDKFKCIPVVLFTASIGHIDEKFKESGADDYFLKPFESGDLLEKIKKFIG